MPSPQTIWTNIREARADFVDLFNQQARQSLFEGIVRRVPAPEGFAKVTGVYPVGSMEVASGSPTINGLTSATYNINTTPKRYTGEIEHELLMKSDAIVSGQVSAIIADSARIVSDDIDQRLSVLLEAGSTTGAGNDIFGAAFFEPTTGKLIPDTSVALINEVSGAYSDSSTETRAAVWAGVTLLHKMRNSLNARIHENPGQKTFIFMYHPDVTNFVMDAIFPQLLNDAARIDGLVVPRANPYLTDADDYFMFVVGAQYAPMILAERGAPEFRTSDGSDESLIYRNGHVWQPYYSAEVGYGSAFSAVMLRDA